MARHKQGRDRLDPEHAEQRPEEKVHGSAGVLARVDPAEHKTDENGQQADGQPEQVPVLEQNAVGHHRLHLQPAHLLPGEGGPHQNLQESRQRRRRHALPRRAHLRLQADQRQRPRCRGLCR